MLEAYFESMYNKICFLDTVELKNLFREILINLFGGFSTEHGTGTDLMLCHFDRLVALLEGYSHMRSLFSLSRKAKMKFGSDSKFHATLTVADFP